MLMAKAPVVGEVKTRLIGAFSPAEATELYINFLRDTFALMERVSEDRQSVSLILCYTPEGEEEAFVTIEREGSLMLAQRGDDLGQRLCNCFADLFELGFDSVVVIGADSPTLPDEFLFEAFDSLSSRSDLVIGPAEDEGYYLIGMRMLHDVIFEEIPWSTGGVLAATSERARHDGLNLITLRVWYDVDTPDELARLEEELLGNRDLARFTGEFLRSRRID